LRCKDIEAKTIEVDAAHQVFVAALSANILLACIFSFLVSRRLPKHFETIASAAL
jgi:hypothetical protein